MANFKVKNGLLAGRYLETDGGAIAGSTNGYQIGALSEDSTFYINSYEATPNDIEFKPDGTKMFLTGQGGDSVDQFSLSTAWDLSTATHDGLYSVSAQETGPRGIAINAAGTQMVIFGIGDDAANVYALSNPWDITSGVSTTGLYATGLTTTMYGLRWWDSGNSVLMIDSTNDRFIQFNCTTPYDFTTYSTATFLTINPPEVSPTGFAVVSDSEVWIHGTSSDSWFRLTLTTPGDISTGSYTGESFYMNAGNLTGSHYFNTDGSKMIGVRNTTDEVVTYSASTTDLELDLAAGTSFTASTTEGQRIIFNNPPVSGVALSFTLEITFDGSYVSWPSSVKWHGGSAPDATASKEMYTFLTVDGGTTYYGKKVGDYIA